MQHWTYADVLRIKAKRQNKYHAVRSESNSDLWPELAGRSFASKLERERAQELVLLLRGGVISDLHFQPRVFLSEAGISYHPDACYTENKEIIYEEIKGLESDRFRIIRKLWRAYGPGILRIVKKGNRLGGLRVTEELIPHRSSKKVENSC